MAAHPAEADIKPQQTRISICADQGYLLKLVFVLLVCLSFTGFVFYLYLKSHLSFWNNLIFGGMLVGGGVVLVGFFFYGVRMMLEVGPVLILDQNGAYDAASLVKIGRIKLGDVRSIGLTRTSIQDVIHITLNPRSSTWVKACNSSLLLQLYSAFFSSTIWVPVDFLRLNPKEIVPVIENFRAMILAERNGQHLTDKVTTATGKVEISKPTPDLKVVKRETSQPIPPLPKPEKLPSSSKVPSMPDELGRSTQSEDDDDPTEIIQSASLTPLPPLPPLPEPNSGILKRLETFISTKTGWKTEPDPRVKASRSAKDMLMEKIEAIKRDVAESNLDQILCDLYLDDVRNFAVWQETQDSRLPYMITRAQAISKGAELEEVSFFFRGHKVVFVLETNVGTPRDAVLSLHWEDREVCVLRVKIEIGELAPHKLRKYLKGQWEAEIRDLYEECLVAKQGGVELEDEASEVTEQTENIEELRKRFGLDED